MNTTSVATRPHHLGARTAALVGGLVLATGLAGAHVSASAATSGRTGADFEPPVRSQEPPRLLKDITPGAGGSAFGSETAVVPGKGVFFAAGVGHDVELWVSDGSTAGTRLVRDINPGPGGSDPANMRVFNGKVVFFATDVEAGRELWISDGTTGGTTRLKDINPGPGSGVGQGSPLNADRPNFTYFAGADSDENFEPWATDGTAAGTVKVADINATGGSDPSNFTVVGNRAIAFTAFDPQHGREPYVTDGKPAGTHLLGDVFPGPGSSDAHDFSDYTGGGFMFAAQSSQGNEELHQSTGPNGPVSLLKEINPGPAGSDITMMQGHSDTLFMATSGASRQIWASDFTPQGTVPVTTFSPGGDPRDLVQSIDSTHFGYYFTADSAGTGRELWTLAAPRDTTPVATFVADIQPGAIGSDPHDFGDTYETYNVEENAYTHGRAFLATTTSHGQELWTAEGTTAASTLRRTDLNPGTGDGVIDNLATMPVGYNALTFFVGDNGKTGPELYVVQLARKIVRQPVDITLTVSRKRVSYQADRNKRLKVAVSLGSYRGQGRVRIYEGKKVIGFAIALQARLTIRIKTRLGVGPHRIYARFSGNYYQPTRSKPVNVRVLPRVSRVHLELGRGQRQESLDFPIAICLLPASQGDL